MIYEVINPSDAVTFEAPSDRIAQLATLLLGEGAYGLEREDGARDVLPIFLFGGADQWLSEHFPEGYGEAVDADGLEIAKALRSLGYCKVRDRKAMIAAIGTDAAALARWNDVKRSSLNNIGKRAQQIAEALEGRVKTPESA